MRFKQFMDMYDNWNGTTRVTDDSFELVVKGNTVDIMESLVQFGNRTKVEGYNELFDMEVIAFGFYDNELRVRVKHSLQQVFKKFCKNVSENSEKGIDK